MPRPKSLGRTAKAIGHYLSSDDSLSRSLTKERAREFEEHTQKYLERKYGKRHVHPQKVSRTTKKRPDFVVE